MKKARPCDEGHNIWVDFPGCDAPCVRCGWTERQIEIYMLEWAIDGHRPKPKLRLVR